MPGANAESVPTLEFERTSRNLRSLPLLLLRAVKLVWVSGPRVALRLAALTVLQSLTTVGQIALAGRLVGDVQKLSDGQGVFADTLPEIIAFATLFVLSGMTSIWLNETRLVLGELASSHSEQEITQAATRAPVIDFDRPDFHDLLIRSISAGATRPLMVATALATIATSTFLVVALVITLAIIEPIVLLPLIAGAPLVWLLTRRATRLSYRFAVDETGYDRRRSYLLSILTLRPFAAEVRSFELADHLGGRFGRLWNQRISRLRSTSVRRGTYNSVGRLVNGVAIGVVIGALVWTVAEGRADLAAATTAAGAVAILGQRLTQLLSGIGTLYECGLFLADVEHFTTSYSTESGEKRRDRSAYADHGELVVDRVSFRYPSSTDVVLDSVSLQVRTGEMIALVGANGSGKTTLSKLLGGLLSPESGTLTWNGEEVMAGSDAWHAHVAISFQDFTKYLLPLSDNVRFGRVAKDGADDSDQSDLIMEALGRVGLDALPESLNEGLATTLGPEFTGGSDLSGGQWQRVAIARAFFRDSPVVILDEPSAALDPDSEEELFVQLQQLCAGRAVVVVSHRLATVTGADRIYVMGDGEILEVGSHNELMKTGGDYARMFRAQADRFTVD